MKKLPKMVALMILIAIPSCSDDSDARAVEKEMGPQLSQDYTTEQGDFISAISGEYSGYYVDQEQPEIKSKDTYRFFEDGMVERFDANGSRFEGKVVIISPNSFHVYFDEAHANGKIRTNTYRFEKEGDVLKKGKEDYKRVRYSNI